MASAIAVGLAMGAGSAAAGIDSSSIVLDGKNRTVEAVQSDTRIDFVAPLDGNPLTREWFHSGAASYLVTGPEAEAWSGHLIVGYQVGYPATPRRQARVRVVDPEPGPRGRRSRSPVAKSPEPKACCAFRASTAPSPVCSARPTSARS